MTREEASKLIRPLVQRFGPFEGVRHDDAHSILGERYSLICVRRVSGRRVLADFFAFPFEV
jgi:hypothetical protein